MNKKKKKNKKRKCILNTKGFSMVEILAVVVILGVISTIGIATVTSIIEKSRIHYYDTQESQLVLAAQSYAVDNKNILPKTTYGMTSILLQTLYDKKYIKEKIVDQNKRICDPVKTHVDIYKSSKTDYKYTGYLNCPSCEDGGYCKTTTTGSAPDITITLPSESQGNNLFKPDSVIKIDYKANGNNALIGSYSYKIYLNNQLKFDSSLKINNKVATKTITEPIAKFLPGKIKVVATLTNTDGQTKTVTKTKDYSDTAFPECGKISYDGAHQMNSYETGTNKTCGNSGYSWVNIGSSPGTRNVWVECDDIEGIGCAQHEFSGVLKSDGDTDFVEIKDAKGNAYNCVVKKCIDKTSPKITVKIFKVKSDGSKDGGAKYTYIVDPQTSTVDYVPTAVVNSTWLNKNNYPYGVMIEVTAEDSLSQIESIVWKQNDKDKKANNLGAINKSVKNITGIDEASKTTSNIVTDDGVRKQEIVVTDNSGNKVTYYLTFYIDRTPPTVPTVNMKQWNSTTTEPTSGSGLSDYSNNTWFSGRVYTYPSGSVDSPDVSGFKEYQYTTTGKTSNETNYTKNFRSVIAEGTSYITWRACDNAGNCSAASETKTILLDRTAPAVPTVNLKKWKTTTAPTSPTGLEDYPENTWFNGKVYTYPTGGAESGDTSGRKEYRYTTTGNTTNNTNTVANFRNIEAQGTSTITWRACDNANNCSDFATPKTIKLDRCEVTWVYWTDWGSCSVDCGGGTRTKTASYRSSVTNHTDYTCPGTPNPSSQSESCNTQSCSTKVVLCRAGATCLNSWASTDISACGITGSQWEEFECDDYNDRFWVVVSGYAEGKYIRKTCTGTTECDGNTCPDSGYSGW